MATQNQQKKEVDPESQHEQRKRRGLERRVPRDEDDHPQEELRQGSVYEEPQRSQYAAKRESSTGGFHPAGYELGGFGGGPGDRPWQVPWGSGYNPEALTASAGGGTSPSVAPDYYAGATPPPTTPPANVLPTPTGGSSEVGAFGGAGLGGYNEGAFTLGPFFGHSIGHPSQRQPALTPPAAPAASLQPVPSGFRGRGPKGYRRSDDRIREDVCERLLYDDYVDASDIEVSVEAGEVTLNGTVPDRETKRRAEDLIDQLSGVQHVQNNLRLNRPARSQ